MGEIVLHVGTGKTGTTALQRFFRLNQDILEKNGYYYPKSGKSKTNEYNTHHLLVRSFWESDNNYDKRYDLLGELRQEISSITDNKNVLISCEDFWLMEKSDLKKVAEYLSDWRCKIIVYFRRQDDYLASAYAQAVKLGMNYSGTISDFYDMPYIYDSHMNYLRHLRKFEKIFGKENIVIRPYEKTQFENGNIFSDFMYHGLNLVLTSEYNIPEKDINPSLSYEALQFKRILNDLFPEKCNMILPKLEEYSLHNQNKPRLLSTQERLEIIKRYEKDNKTISKEYLGRYDGKLFYDFPKNEEKHNEELSIEQTLDICKFLFNGNDVENLLKKIIIKGTADVLSN